MWVIQDWGIWYLDPWGYKQNLPRAVSKEVEKKMESTILGGVYRDYYNYPCLHSLRTRGKQAKQG